MPLQSLFTNSWLCCAQVLLTATAYYDGTQRHVRGAAPLEYYGYGSAASEVEVRAHVFDDIMLTHPGQLT